MMPSRGASGDDGRGIPERDVVDLFPVRFDIRFTMSRSDHMNPRGSAARERQESLSFLLEAMMQRRKGQAFPAG